MKSNLSDGKYFPLLSTTIKIMPASISPIILSLLLDTIVEEMVHMEGLQGFPKDVHWVCLDGKPDKLSRSLLKAMSLVCREWTKPAQDILHHRVFLRSPSLQQFLDSQLSGPWVRELQFWEHHRSEHQDEKTALLSKLFAERLTGLVALSVGSEYRSSWPRNIAPYLSSLASVTHLRALHIQCLLGPKSLFQIYRAIARMHNLETLSLLGTWEDEGDNRPLASELIGMHPPASLKRLLFRLEVDAMPTQELLSWILQARDDYALQELRLVVTVLEGNDNIGCYGPTILESLLETLPLLKTLLLGDSYTYPIDIQRALVDKCTSLRELHLFAEPEHSLPPSLERLCWGHDTFQRFGTIEFEDMVLSRFLELELASGGVSNLRFVHISNADVGEFFPQTKKVCHKHGIKFIRGCNLSGTWSRD